MMTAAPKQSVRIKPSKCKTIRLGAPYRGCAVSRSSLFIPPLSHTSRTSVSPHVQGNTSVSLSLRVRTHLKLAAFSCKDLTAFDEWRHDMEATSAQIEQDMSTNHDLRMPLTRKCPRTHSPGTSRLVAHPRRRRNHALPSPCRGTQGYVIVASPRLF
jgi:hypothetical protein